jgi:bacteriorhodopsin
VRPEKCEAVFWITTQEKIRVRFASIKSDWLWVTTPVGGKVLIYLLMVLLRNETNFNRA